MFSSRSQISLAGAGVSGAEDAKVAVAAAVAACKVPKPTMAFCACTVAHDANDVQKEFAKLLPGVPMHGLTSSGAILQPGGATPAGVGCLLLDAVDGSFATGFSADGDAASAANAVKDKMAKPSALILSATPGAEEGALLAIADIFPGVPVYGGTAADNDVSGKWSVFSAGAVSSKGVALVGVGAAIKFGASMTGPYKPTTKKAIATECDGRKVGKIDGKPAGDWVYEWLGEAVQAEYEAGGMILGPTSQKPIGIKQPTGEIVSAHLAVMGGKADGSVTLFTPVPEGAEVVVMDSGDGPATGYAGALAGAYKTAVGGFFGAKPKAALLVYCGGMAIAVGDKLDTGLKGPLLAATAGVPVLGMTCFGEQGVCGKAGNVQRNLSMGVLTFA